MHLPPGLQLVDAVPALPDHRLPSSSSANRSIRRHGSARSARATRCWPTVSRSGLIVTSIGRRLVVADDGCKQAPEASARFICDLKLPPPQCSCTEKPSSRSCFGHAEGHALRRLALMHDIDVRRLPRQIGCPDRATAPAGARPPWRNRRPAPACRPVARPGRRSDRRRRPCPARRGWSVTHSNTVRL